jgi:uncharacterized repeat protein (TIGR03803 family)
LSPLAADAVPQIGTFFSTQNRPPLPYDWLPENFPVYSLGSGSFVVDDSAVNYANLKNANGYSKDDVPLPGGGDDGGGSTNSPDGISYSFSTNGLWLGISGITDDVVSLTLNNATNYVYEIFSTTSLTNPLSDWNIETEVFPTNQDVMPFTVPVLDRTNNLFFFARDWTGITSNGNTVPDWWLFYWYGVAGLSLSDSTPDASGQQTLLYDFTHGINPLAPFDTPPLYIMPPYAHWNVTDISDPGQPVSIGGLPEPFSEPDYVSGTGAGVPPFNTPWHTNTSMMLTEAYGTTFADGAGKGTVFKIYPEGPPQGCQPNELTVSGNLLFGTTAGFGGNAFEGNGAIFSLDTNGSGFTNLHGFNLSSGAQPEAGMALSGNTLYGTTYSGGNGYGAVFSFDTTNGVYAILYTFDGYDAGDGQFPQAKLILSGSTLYGTTSSGGAHNKGTIFEVGTDGSGYSILHSFGGSDGETPEAALLLSGGVLYGTTAGGGTHDLGTVFSFNLSSNIYAILHDFGGSGDDGIEPEAGLVISGGTLYGTTASGGSNGYGTVFGITTGGTNYNILHSFNESNTNDGAYPVAGLTLSGSSLYGTTQIGGANNHGVVFSINTSGAGYTNLYSFQDGPDGQLPDTTLALAGDTLYGTTPGDSSLVGDPNYGTIFSIKTNGGNFTVLDTFYSFAVLHTFTGGDGENPCSQLALSGSAFWGIPTTLYGTTSGSGSSNYGTVFRVNTDGTGFTNLYQFTGSTDGKYPQTGLLISGNTLYGTTTNSLFKINTDGGGFSCLTNIDGASQLILSMSGNTLYGTTKNGGAGYGSVFSMNTDGSGFTNLHSFSGGAGGQYPSSGLELYGIGSFLAIGPAPCMLYGTTESGGTNGFGMVFSINADGSGFTNLYDFDGTNDGAYPVGGLLVTNNNISGNSTTHLFGTTSSGGTNGGGTLWSINPNSPVGSFQPLYSFGGTPGAGTQPEGKLAFSGSVLFGTTAGGGAYTNGTVFGVNSDGTGFTDLYDFSGGSDGGSPLAGLTLAVADNLVSIWSLDTTINVSAGNVSNLVYSIAIDNMDALYVNGNFVSWTNHDNAAQLSLYASLPFLHEGTNDIKVVIAGDADTKDYFAMVIKSDAPGVVFTNTVFGTTYNGGNGNGTVFEITPEGDEADLYTFSNSLDGANPIGDLVLSGGTLYGVTQNGGLSDRSGAGTIFSLATNGAFQTLYTFTNLPGGGNNDGANPAAGLVLSGNTLYGTTEFGGSPGSGTIFSIKTNGSGYATLYSFAGGSDGANPAAPLLLASNTLYGTASDGDAYGRGTIFSIGTNGSNYQTIYNFGTNSNDGFNSQAGLAFFSNTLYGVAAQGGTNGNGEIFRINTNGSEYTNLYSFGGQPDGANPVAGLILSSNRLYGTTYEGGVNNAGTIFSIGVGGAGYTILQSFGSSDSDDPENPKADLIILGNSLYGTTYQGGAYNGGMVFSIGTDGSDFNDIHDFMGNPDGENPFGGLCAP